MDTETPTDPATEPSAEEVVDAAVREGGTLDVAAAARLRIRVTSGEVDVIGRDEPGASIEVHEAAGGSLPVRLAGGVLRVGAESPSGQGSKAAVTVRVDRRAQVDVGVTSAAVLVSGMKNGVDVRTVSGDVVCDATAGRAVIEGVSAELAVREHEGPLRITTVSGAATASGAVTRFDCTGVSGDVFLDLEAPDSVEVRSVSGEVVLRLGDERAAEYAVDSVSGTLHVDGADAGRLLGGYRGAWTGAGGDPTHVRVETSSGTVRIVHTGER